ncbi:MULTISPECIES: hypothetical protein [Mycolicibacter]|uniref:hypothetical protein n=1 Tax=Mycolicibacter TaxID=1073531 RepID=UPI000A72FA28|nr:MULTISPECIES: hypothetical protein [Mycolicibacter]
MPEQVTDVFLLTYLGKPVDAFLRREDAAAELSTYSVEEQSVMEIVPVRLIGGGEP